MANETINQQSEDGSPTTDDFLLAWDVTTGTTKKITIANTRTAMEVTRFNMEILGRTTLGGSADTITVNPITAKKYLKIIIHGIATGGTIRCNIRFNNDSGNNYSYRRSENNGAQATATSAALLVTTTASAQNQYLVVDVINTLADVKQIIWLQQSTGGATATTAPNTTEGAGKWVDTDDQIVRVDIINDGTGDLATGSEVLVLGHD